MSNQGIPKEIDLIKDIKKSLEFEVESLADKQALEIDFTELFDDLSYLLKYIIQNQLTGNNIKVFKYSLIAFALEIAKKPVRSFWNELFEQLDINNSQKNRNLIFENLWKTLKSVGVEPEKTSSRRLLVGTLRMKVEADPKFLNDATQFFIDYYKNHYKENMENVLKNSALYNNYKNKNRYEQFLIIAKNLKEIVDFVIKNELDSLEDEQKIQNAIINKLKIDPKKYTRKRISTIVKDVLNRISPRRFKKVLKENWKKDVIIPTGKSVKCSLLESLLFGYGIYEISGILYQVTPDLRISLEEIKKWPFEKIGHFNNFSYYKKKVYFKSSIGQVRDYIYEGEMFYLWYGTVPIGEKYNVDEKYEIKEGFIWTPGLRLVWAHNDKPTHFTIEIGKLNCFYKNKVRKDLKICLQNQIKSFRLSAEGAISLRNLEFEINGSPVDLSLEVYLDGEKIKEVLFKLEECMLFSSSTRDLIRSNRSHSNITKRRFGEEKYYLFSIYPKTNINCNESLFINKIEDFGNYEVYEVEWQSDTNFSLKVWEFEWKFEKKKYLEWWFKNNENIFSSIQEAEITFNTNFEGGKSEESIFIRILNKDHEPIIETFELDKDYFKANNNIKGDYILKNALTDDLTPGEYVFELDLNYLVYKRNFYIIPDIKIEWPTILEENHKSIVKICTIEHENVLYNPKISEGDNKLVIPLIGKTITIYDKNKKFPLILNKESSIKVSFLLEPDREKFVPSFYRNTFITKEFFPEKNIWVFGYRIFIKSNENYYKTHELTYYDIEDALVLVFTIPGTIVEIMYNSTPLISLKANDKGYCKFNDISALKKFCKSSITLFEIKGCSISKNLLINWYPQVYSIENLELLENKLRVSLNYEGPKGSNVILKLMDNKTEVLEDKLLSCQNVKESEIIEFELKDDLNEILYILTYTSVNGEILPSKYLKCYNRAKNEIKISIKDDKVKTSLDKFLENIVNVAEYVLSKKEIVKLKIPDSSTQIEFVELLGIINSNIQILVPYSNQKESYNIIKKITKNNSCINTLKEGYNTLDNILNPITCRKIVDCGISISPPELIADIKDYLPKPDPVVIVDGQYLNVNEKNKIFSFKDRTVIFIERRI